MPDQYNGQHAGNIGGDLHQPFQLDQGLDRQVVGFIHEQDNRFAFASDQLLEFPFSVIGLRRNSIPQLFLHVKSPRVRSTTS